MCANSELQSTAVNLQSTHKTSLSTSTVNCFVAKNCASYIQVWPRYHGWFSTTPAIQQHTQTVKLNKELNLCRQTRATRLEASKGHQT